MADDGGEVQVRLSQEGGDEVIAKLKEITTAIGGVRESTDRLNETGKDVFGSSLVTAANQALELFQKIGEAIKGTVEKGFELNAASETMRITLSGTISQFNSVADGIDKWALASGEATNALSLLRAEAVKSGDSVGELTHAFQRLYGVATQSGGSTEEIVRLTGAISSFATVTGMEASSAAMQFSRAMDGIVMRRGPVGEFFRSLGIDAATLRTWQSQGESVQKLTEALAQYEALGPKLQETWKGVTQNLKTAWDDFLKTVTGPSFENLKSTLSGLLGQVLNLNGPDAGKLKGPVADFAKELAVELADIVRAFSPVIAGFVQLGAVAVKVVMDVVHALTPLAPALTEALNVLTKLVGAFGEMGVVAAVAVQGFSTINSMFSNTGSLAGGMLGSLQSWIKALGEQKVLTGEVTFAMKGMEMVATETTTTLGAMAAAWAPLVLVITGAIAALGAFYLAYKKIELLHEEEAARNAGEGLTDPTLVLAQRAMGSEDFTGAQKAKIQDLRQEVDKYVEALDTARTTEAGYEPGVYDEAAIEKSQAALLTATKTLNDYITATKNANKAKLEADAAPTDSQKMFQSRMQAEQAEAKAREALAAGDALKLLQIENGFNIEMEKLQHTRSEQKKDQQAVTDRIIAAKTLEHHNQLAAFERQRALDAKKNEDAIASIREEAAQAQLQGAGLEEQKLGDARNAAMRKAAEELQASIGDSEEKRRQAQDKFNATLLAEDAKYYAALSNLREKLSMDLDKQAVGYDVETLKAQGKDFEAELKGLNQKLVDEERAFAIQYRDEFVKAMTLVGPQQDGVAEMVGKISAAFDELKTATAATAPAIRANLQSLLDALSQMGAAPELVEKMRRVITSMGAEYAAKGEEIVQKNGEQIGAMTGDWTVFWNKQLGDIENHKTTYSDALTALGSAQAKWAADGQAGVEAAFNQIRGTVKSFGTDVATLLTGVWGSLTQGFETGFYDILSGKFDDLKNVFASLWDSILKDFSKMLSQMLVRWLITGEAMGNGKGTGGLMGSLMNLLGSGSNVPTTTPGGTGATTPGGVSGGVIDMTTMGYGNQGSYTQGPPPGQVGGSGWGAAAGVAGGAIGILGGLYTGVSSVVQPHETYQPTYQGQDVPYSGNFGGPGGGAALTGAVAAAGGAIIAGAAVATAAAAAASAMAAGATVSAVTAAAAGASIVPVIGWIVAAALLVVAAIMYIFSGPGEEHVKVAVADAFKASGADNVVGGFVSQIIDSTANFVGSLALKAAGPDGVGKFMTAYNTAFKQALGTATFDIAAGSKEDLQKDVENFFNQVLPKLAMQAAFGQVGVGQPLGDRDWIGGAAGLDWNTNNANMDAQGNFVKKQLYDPNAPIPMLLSGIGFTQERIAEIATKLSTSADMKVFKQWLSDLVGVVVDLGDLAKKFGRTTQEWFEEFKKIQSQEGTAAQFADQLKNLKGQGVLLDTMFGDERVSAAKQLVTDSGTLLNNMGQALASIYAMVDAIKASVTATVAGYKDKLLTPDEREAKARTDYTTDVAKIADAANPKEVQAAWQQVMRDLSQILDAIVARIQNIKALQQSYADFRTQMAKDAGPQFGTDPSGWLAQNSADITKVTTALSAGTGDAVKNAGELLRLTQERYTNEVAQLAKINGLIQSITDTAQGTRDNLTMQAMGKVVTDPKTGAKSWVPDTHAQGDYLKGQYDSLMAQMAKATTPEEVQRLYGKIQNIISQLAAQPQDPTHYEESRTKLLTMNDAAEKTAKELLKGWGKDLSDDLTTVGGKLAAGEKALATALDAAQKDFDKQLGLMVVAGDQATQALYAFADGLTTVMQELVKTIQHWTWTLTHKDTEQDPNWDYDKNAPKTTTTGGGGATMPPDKWEDDPDDPDYQINKHWDPPRRRLKPGGHTSLGPDNQSPATAPAGPGANATAGGNYQEEWQKQSLADLAARRPPINVNVTVNSGSPEEIADAAAAALRGQLVAALRQNNVELVRVIRNNPSLTTPAWQPSVR